MSNTVILIPSRLAATRLPNKPLLKINNISIINHVYKIAKSSLIGESYVATGDKEIFEEVTKLGGKCILTKKDHKTGTDRIFEAYQELRDDNIEYVINLQGDEPMLDIEDVNNLLKKTILYGCGQPYIQRVSCRIVLRTSRWMSLQFLNVLYFVGTHNGASADETHSFNDDYLHNLGVISSDSIVT